MIINAYVFILSYKYMLHYSFFFYKNIMYDFSFNEKHIGCVWLVGYGMELDWIILLYNSYVMFREKIKMDVIIQIFILSKNNPR